MESNKKQIIELNQIIRIAKKFNIEIIKIRGSTNGVCVHGVMSNHQLIININDICPRLTCVEIYKPQSNENSRIFFNGQECIMTWLITQFKEAHEDFSNTINRDEK
ncbi:hypothetical protein PTW35_09645 [Photobacterium sp. DA100]|uniref:hypothetical protein n=1 Tax=Photobacterium sp. DA100 TaxID=3027472 RepID=UPI00247AAE4E|nr:hypothetical protein [Photobacterium sp. DA100]WEM40911.1 hypothetical protein PTW35_09645 [Photobacterium sp. DA100]